MMGCGNRSRGDSGLNKFINEVAASSWKNCASNELMKRNWPPEQAGATQAGAAAGRRGNGRRGGEGKVGVLAAACVPSKKECRMWRKKSSDLTVKFPLECYESGGCER